MNYRLETHVGMEQLSVENRQTAVAVELLPDGDVEADLPIHVVFCVDTSTSMNHGPLETAKDGLREAAKRLSSADTVGVVQFASSAEVVLDPVSGTETSQITDAVTSLQASGQTNLTDGLAKSRAVLSRMSSHETDESEAITRIVLLTDGQPNKKNLEPFDIDSGGPKDIELNKQIGSELNQDGITVHSAGVGRYNEGVLDALSDKSGGEWEHLSSATEIADFFENQITDARSIVGTNPVLELTLRNGTAIDNIVQKVPNVGDPTIEQHGDRYVIHAADISAEKPPQYTFDATAPELDSGVKTLVDIDLTVGSVHVSDSVDVKFVSATLQDEDAGENWVTREHGEAVGISENKDEMDKQERHEATSKYVQRGN